MAKQPVRAPGPRQTSLLPAHHLNTSEADFFAILLQNAVTAQNLLTTALQKASDPEHPEPLSPDTLINISARAMRAIKELYEIVELKSQMQAREGKGGTRIMARIGIRQPDGTEAAAEIYAQR